MPSKTNRPTGISALSGGLMAFLRRLRGALRRQPAARGGSVSSAKSRDRRVVEATRRRPSGASKPGSRKTAKRPQRRK